MSDRCGAAGIGRYCANCGTVLAGGRDLSVKHFLKEAAFAFTDFDSALIASFRALIFKPGVLTAEYLRGERHRFLPPFRVFLFCNILYFLAVAQFHVTVLTAPLRVQADEMTYFKVSRAILATRYPALTKSATAAEKATSDLVDAAITTKYDGVTEGIGKLIVVVLIPFYALLFEVLFVGSKRYFAEHLIFATHFVAFLLLAIPLTGIAAGGVAYLVSRLTPLRVPDSEFVYGGAVLAAVGIYAFVAQRTVYHSARISTVDSHGGGCRNHRPDDRCIQIRALSGDALLDCLGRIQTIGTVSGCLI